MKHLIALSLFLVACGGLTFGCGAAQAIENKLDCGAICNRYKSCFDGAYDVDTCKARCESSAKNDTSYESKVNVCSACIDDKSCTAATFKCGTECSAIVP